MPFVAIGIGHWHFDRDYGITLATSYEELTHWKRLWCWEGLGAGGEGDNRGWDGWMASLTQWTWVWVNSGSWWWTGLPGVLRFMGSQRVEHDWATDLIWSDTILLFIASGFTFTIRIIHNWASLLLWLSLFIPFGAISLLFSSSILGTYWPGEFIFQCRIFLPLQWIKPNEINPIMISVWYHQWLLKFNAKESLT